MALGVGDGVTSCGNQTAETGALTITGSHGSLEIGASVQLAVEGATEISFSSSNTDVVTVTATGLMKGIAEGTATIIAKSGDLEGTISVTVVKKAHDGDGAGDDGNQEESLLANITQDSCPNLKAAIPEGKTYCTSACTDIIGGLTFAFTGDEKVGFVNPEYNDVVGTELKGMQYKKSSTGQIVTTTSFTATKIVVNCLMQEKFSSSPSCFDIKVGSASGVLNIATAAVVGSKDDKQWGKVYAAEATFTFSNATGTLDISNSNLSAVFFNSIKIYGSINA